MLTSLILSLTMNMSPAEPVENNQLAPEIGFQATTLSNNLQSQEANRTRGSIRINKSCSNVERTNRTRGSIRINESCVTIEKTNRTRGSIRI